MESSLPRMEYSTYYLILRLESQDQRIVYFYFLLFVLPRPNNTLSPCGEKNKNISFPLLLILVYVCVVWVLHTTQFLKINTNT